MAVSNNATGETRTVNPVYKVNSDRSVENLPIPIEDWGLSVAFAGMNVDSRTIGLTIDGVQVAKEDWLVVQAYEKPVISLVWIGFILLSLGFVVAMWRRIEEERFEAVRSA